MQIEVVLSFIRQIAIFVGGMVVATGYVTAGQWELLTGAVITIVPVVWGLVSKWKDQQIKMQLVDEKKDLKAELKDVKANVAANSPLDVPPGGFGTGA